MAFENMVGDFVLFGLGSFLCMAIGLAMIPATVDAFNISSVDYDILVLVGTLMVPVLAVFAVLIGWIVVGVQCSVVLAASLFSAARFGKSLRGDIREIIGSSSLHYIRSNWHRLGAEDQRRIVDLAESYAKGRLQ